jgi:hypothetical protein
VEDLAGRYAERLEQLSASVKRHTGLLERRCQAVGAVSVARRTTSTEPAE